MSTERFVNPEDVKKLHGKGYNDVQIAQDLGFGIVTIIKCRCRLGLPAIIVGESLCDDIQYWDLYQKGYNDHQIAQKVGLTQEGIYLWRKRNGLPQKKVRTSKVDRVLEEIGENIKVLYSQGYNDPLNGRYLNISIYAIKKGREQNTLPEALIGSKEINDGIDPLKDKESLYCDTEFLEKFLNKKLKGRNVLLS